MKTTRSTTKRPGFVRPWMWMTALARNGVLVFGMALIGGLLCAREGEAGLTYFFQDQTIEAKLLADTTTQYVANYFRYDSSPDDYYVEVVSKNPAFTPVMCPPAIDQDVASIVAVASHTYDYGFADGMDSQRKTDLYLLNGIMPLCSTMSCSDAFSELSSTITQQGVQ